MAYENEYSIQWFDLLTFRDSRYCWYAHGKWVGHLMDWRGCNFHHGRVPGSPTFATIPEALRWLQTEIANGRIRRGMVFSGHHSGEGLCSKGCDDREVAHLSVFRNGLHRHVKITMGNEDGLARGFHDIEELTGTDEGLRPELDVPHS